MILFYFVREKQNDETHMWTKVNENRFKRINGPVE